LDKLEIYLGRKIKRLGFDQATKTGKDFFHHLKMKDGMLPSPQLEKNKRSNLSDYAIHSILERPPFLLIN
jgi:hypothetical protein